MGLAFRVTGRRLGEHLFRRGESRCACIPIVSGLSILARWRSSVCHGRRSPAPRGVAPSPRDTEEAAPEAVSSCIAEYQTLFGNLLAGPVAPATAPVPDDPTIRADNLKSHAYFLDAVVVGCCRIEPDDWSAPEHPQHDYACVFVVEFARTPGIGEPGDRWTRGANVARTDLRCAELAVVLSGYIRQLGFDAQGHFAGHSLLDMESLAVRAGVAGSAREGSLLHPICVAAFGSAS